MVSSTHMVGHTMGTTEYMRLAKSTYLRNGSAAVSPT